jgi:tetratricopeptide (TPR) repeat protein
MPKNFDQQLAQASQLLRAKKYVAVIELAEIVLGSDRKNLHALLMLGHACFGLRRLDDAARALEQAAKLQPDNADTLVTLGQIQLRRNKYSSALRYFDRTLKIDPHRTEAICGKAQVYDRQQADDKLAAYLEPLLNADDPPEGVLTAYAGMLERSNRPEDAVAALNGKYPDGDIPQTHDARVLMLQKGRLLEKLDRHAEALDAFIAGQRILGTDGYNPDHDRAMTDAFIRTFSADHLADMPEADNDIDLPVFIVGMPRTGSTLIDRIISAHPQAASADETAILGDLTHHLAMTIGSTQTWPHCVLDCSADDLNNLARSYTRQLRDYSPRATRITDKLLQNYKCIGLIIKMLPHAKIIDCRRDPMDSCISTFALSFPPKLHPYQARLDWLGHRYRQYQRLMDHWEAVVPDAFLTVQYEDLVADQETWSRRIIEYIGLPWDDRCLDFHKQKQEARSASREQVTRPIYTSSVGRAKRFGHLLDPLREALTDEPVTVRH